MSNSTNMGMPVPVVGTTGDPDWSNDIVNSLNIIDVHDHSNGSGVAITPSGININADLTFSTHSATNLLKAAFTSQSVAISGTNFLSFVGGNLYANDGSGNQIPITSGGGVAGSPGSIGSLVAPASASYSAGSKTFTWKADSTKSAAMDNGAVTIRETNVASAKGITLASPSSLAADYQLTLLTGLPGSTQAVNCDSSGNLSTITYDNIGVGIGAAGANSIITAATTSPAGANWTPVYSVPSGSIGITTSLNTYWRVGNLIFYVLAGTLNSQTITNTLFYFTLPADPGVVTGQIIGNGRFGNQPAYTVQGNASGAMRGSFVRTDAGNLNTGTAFSIMGFYNLG